MTARYDAALLARIADVRLEPDAPPATDRTFELPSALLLATVGLYFAIVAVFAIGFRDPGLIVPIGICVTYIAMAFGTPAMWARMKPEHKSRALGWSAFVRDGIDTYTGRLGAKEASVQVLILPVLILGWAVATTLIAAIVL